MSEGWIFNHWGELEIGPVPISTTPRGWVLNGYGRCDFAINYSETEMLKEKYIRFGNFIHIKHNPSEDGAGASLPDWTGIIVPNRTWNRDAVACSAVSVEALLAYRAMPFVKVEGSADSVFRQIIDYAHASTQVQNSSLRVHLGRVDVPGTLRTSTIFGQAQYATYSDELRANAYDHIVKMTKAVGMDWDITGEILPQSFALKLSANLYNRKGREGLVLTPANSDDVAPLLTEQGTITNHIYAYNQANTAETRIMVEIVAQDSIDKYGVFQTNTVFTGITENTSMTERAGQAQSTHRGEPVRIVKRTALDVSDTFDYIEAGNTCYIHDPRVGFNEDGSTGFRSWARILSADYNDMTNKCGLNVELIDRTGVESPDPDSFIA